jgi:hypothetical protein
VKRTGVQEAMLQTELVPIEARLHTLLFGKFSVRSKIGTLAILRFFVVLLSPPRHMPTYLPLLAFNPSFQILSNSSFVIRPFDAVSLNK